MCGVKPPMPRACRRQHCTRRMSSRPSFRCPAQILRVPPGHRLAHRRRGSAPDRRALHDRKEDSRSQRHGAPRHA
jgi:hypothetical protein